MKRLATVLLLVCFAATLPAHADEASRRVKAQQMVNLLHMDRLMKQVMDGVMQQMSASTRSLAGSQLTSQQQAQLEAFQNKVFALMDAQIGWKVMEPTYVDLYAKTFSDDELDGIIAFYKSPAGISLVEKLPGLTTQAQQIVQQKLAELQPQLKQMIEDFAAQASKQK